MNKYSSYISDLNAGVTDEGLYSQASQRMTLDNKQKEKEKNFSFIPIFRLLKSGSVREVCNIRHNNTSQNNKWSVFMRCRRWKTKKRKVKFSDHAMKGVSKQESRTVLNHVTRWPCYAQRPNMQLHLFQDNSEWGGVQRSIRLWCGVPYLEYFGRVGGQ